MRLFVASVLCATVVLATSSASARALAAEPTEATPDPPVAAPAPVEPPGTDAEAVDRAEEAWSRGGWAEVREVLEPVANHPNRLQDAALRERALCLLADATVSDTDLDKEEREEVAGSYLERLLEADPGWRLMSGLYSPELFALFVQVQDRFNKKSGAQCEADRVACRADLAYAQKDLEELRVRYADLEQRYNDQEVEVRDRVARTRALALIPAGVGHFYNGDRGLGAAFLTTEVGVGAAGLGLILYRTIADGCRRERGFQRGSLLCGSNRVIDRIVRRRKAEEAVGWVFIGSILVDIAIAQVRFRPIRTESVRRVPRKELEGDGSAGDNRRRRRDSSTPPRSRKPRAKVRPTGSGGRNGFSLGVSVRF